MGREVQECGFPLERTKQGKHHHGSLASGKVKPKARPNAWGPLGICDWLTLDPLLAQWLEIPGPLGLSFLIFTMATIPHRLARVK